eukprot:13975505-Alexandrium_andersonii.AAC.1
MSQARQNQCKDERPHASARAGGEAASLALRMARGENLTRRGAQYMFAKGCTSAPFSACVPGRAAQAL